jgi:hypothetical protein
LVKLLPQKSICICHILVRLASQYKNYKNVNGYLRNHSNLELQFRNNFDPMASESAQPSLEHESGDGLTPPPGNSF